MKKTTKTVKTPAPATKLTAPAPARKSTIAPKIKQAAAASLAAPAIMAKPKAAGVTITAKVDVGFGNTLFLRGNGAGLNWSKGTPLACVSSDTWCVVQDYLPGRGDTVTVTPPFWREPASGRD